MSIKRLLILGAAHTMEIIAQKAKDMGVTVIVTDYKPDLPATRIADESYLVSTHDIDGLVKLCADKKIDGVMTGFTDSLLPYYIELCKRMGYPCYITREQMRLNLDKRFFKDTCRAYSIPVVPEFSTEDIVSDNVEYPIIIKPIDNSGSRGITVCNHRDEVKAGIRLALEWSEKKEYVIERYMTCDDLVIYYNIQNGVASLSAVNDPYMNNDQIGCPTQPMAHIYPSKHTRRVLDELDDKLKALFADFGFRDGSVFIQAFVDDEQIYVFEMGYRLCGSREFIVVSSENDVDSLECYIQFAISGKYGESIICERENPLFRNFYITLSFLLRNGHIACIKGFNVMKVHPNVIGHIQSYKKGDTMTAAGTMAQIFGKLYVKATTLEELKKAVIEIQSAVEINDDNGESLLLRQFDPDKLLTHYTQDKDGR